MESPSFPQSPPAPVAEPPQPDRPRRPGGLLAVLVLAVVLGGGGACAGAMGLVGALLQGAMGQAQQQMLTTAGDPAAAELQRQLTERLQEVQATYLPWTLTDASMSVLVSILLLVGAILSFSYSERGRKLLMAAMAVGAVVTLVSTGIGLTVQDAIMDATMGSMGEMVAADGTSPPPDFGQTMGVVGDVTRVVTVVFAIGWMVLKLAYFGVSTWYLRRQPIRALFGADD